MISDEIDYIWPLYDIQIRLDIQYNISVSLTQLQSWEGESKKREGGTGFPEPYTILGRYKLYDLREVAEWITLWRRATARMGHPEGLKNNGTR